MEPRSSSPPLIEIGWIVVGVLDPVDERAAEAARVSTRALLEQAFPDFSWSLPPVRQAALNPGIRVEPTVLLDYGTTERDAKHWDFALVITGADLESHYRPFTLGVTARSIGVAALSTFRIDPDFMRTDADEDERARFLEVRIRALFLHAFGHLNGLGHAPTRTDFMYDLDGPRDLDAMAAFEVSRAELAEALAEVADPRLEEREVGTGGTAGFYLRTMWTLRADIMEIVMQARPWIFPVHLSRLTAAALSTLLVLVVTAESWDLGMTRPPGTIAIMSGLALVGTSAFILRRQGLLMQDQVERLSEQVAVTNIAMTVVVVLGMLVSYALMFGLVLLLSQVFFSPHLVEVWAASLEGRIEWWHYPVFAGFVASLGLVIGALGASFEAQVYFRHIARVDEEI